MINRTATIVLPDGYADAAEFAKDCGFELASMPREEVADDGLSQLPRTLEGALTGILRCADRLKRMAVEDVPPVLVRKEAELIEMRVEKAFASLPAAPANGVHASDCALHSAPALPIGPCDCGVELARTSAPARKVAAVRPVSAQETPGVNTIRAKNALSNIAKIHGYELNDVQLSEAVRAVARALDTTVSRPHRGGSDG